MIPQFRIAEDVRRWLKEDIPFWDNSSQAIPHERISVAHVFAKQEGIISGIDVAVEVFKVMGVEVLSRIKDGEHVEPGTDLLRLKGEFLGILRAERVALNILSHMSGISTTVNMFVDRARKINPNVRIACTRKTLPGLRPYQKWAVHIGGGDTHRMSLSDMIMLKENHLKAFGSITEALFSISSVTSFAQKIEVEVETEEAALEAIETGVPDIIMLDNFTPDRAGQAVEKLRGIDPTILIEASGNINGENLDEYAKTGVDIISMGGLTHSVKGLDISLKVID